jgi:hypothetical protein
VSLMLAVDVEPEQDEKGQQKQMQDKRKEKKECANGHTNAEMDEQQPEQPGTCKTGKKKEEESLRVSRYREYTATLALLPGIASFHWRDPGEQDAIRRQRSGHFPSRRLLCLPYRFQPSTIQVTGGSRLALTHQCRNFFRAAALP